MKIIVTGSRDWDDKHRLERALTYVHKLYNVDVLVHGAARGADRLAAIWATYKGIDVKPYPADWGLYGKSAGPVRNHQMLHENLDARMCVAFPLPDSVGTYDMTKRVETANKEGICKIKIWTPYEP